MAAQLSPLSLEEFHRLYDGAKPAYEYWNGAAVRKSMPTALHGIVQFLIMMLLEKAGWNTASEVRLRLDSDAEPIPDVIAIRGKFKGRYPTVAPELCIEILSAEDSLSKAVEKAHRYLSWGVKCVWIVDPEKRTAWTLLGQNAPEPAGTLQIEETVIELTELFVEVDKKLEVAE